MTALDASPPVPEIAPPPPPPDHVAASTGVLSVNTRIPDPVEPAPTSLLTMRENPELSLTGENWQRARCCQIQPVRGYIDGCSPVYDINTDEHKCVQTCWSSVAFQPFTVYALEEIACLGGPVDVADEAAYHMARGADFSVTTELDYSPWRGNPSLRSEALDITPIVAGVYAPVSPTQGLAMLHAKYRRRAAGGFVLHVPIESLPAFVMRGQITIRGGIVRTVTGITVNTGVGFTGVAPKHDADGNEKVGALLPNPADPESGLVTIYATRSVPEYKLGEITNYNDVFGASGGGAAGPGVEHHPRTNALLAESVRSAALRFDPFCIFSIQISLREEVVGQ